MAGEGEEEGKVFGMAVDSACRLMALTGANQILTSRLVQEEASLAAVRPPEGHEVVWAAHGRYLLKGLVSSSGKFSRAVRLFGMRLSPPTASGRRQCRWPVGTSPRWVHESPFGAPPPAVRPSY